MSPMHSPYPENISLQFDILDNRPFRSLSDTLMAGKRLLRPPGRENFQSLGLVLDEDF
jgi:hypothetical protein